MAAARRSFRQLCRSLRAGTSAAVQAEVDRVAAAVQSRVGRSVNAVVSVAPPAAVQADAARASALLETLGGAGGSRDGAKDAVSMCGVPVMVKDCIHVAGMETSNGEPGGEVASGDALVVAHLRAAGAIIVGKTNLPAGSMDVQTLNERWGTTNNPLNETLTAGGSSGGSAAAVAAGLCDVALGTDLAGSLRIPAAFCGVTSLRPSHGRVPVDGSLPAVTASENVVRSAARLGAIGRDVDALRAFLQAMGTHHLSETAEGETDARARLPFAVTPALPGVLTAGVISDALRDLNARVNASESTSATEHNSVLSERLLRDAGAAHAAFCSTWLPGARPVKAEAVQAAVKARNAVDDAINEVLDTHRAWVLPTTTTLPFPHNPGGGRIDVDEHSVSYWRAMIPYVTPLTVTGHPVVCLPMFFGPGRLPVGVQVVGRHGCDEELLDACRALAPLACRESDWWPPEAWAA